MTATMPRQVVIDQPGVYDGMSDAEYHSDPVPAGSLSSSGARRLLPPSCPALFKHERDHGRPPKREFDFGHAAHAKVLGVGADIVVAQKTAKDGTKSDADDYKTKSAQEHADEIRAEGKVPLLAREVAQVDAMATALREHPIASILFDPDMGKPEQSAFWVDVETGIWCRARFDWLPNPRDGRLIIPDYKGLALDTSIPTPGGWTTMRDLGIGDQVFDSAGHPCTVTAKSDVHYRRCYRIRFDDGSSVICDDEHRWLTTSGRIGKRYQLTTAVRTTEEIRQTLRLYGACQHRVPVAGSLDLPDADLPIDPYVFGCWLGDGTAADGRISKPDEELFEHIAERGYEASQPAAGDRCTRTVYGLRTQLRKAGLLGHKFIPSAYLRSSQGQRIELLRGLMDTDGSWNATRQQAVFTSTDKALALAVRELACSLGQRAVLHTVTQHGYGLTVEAYKVTFTPVDGLNPFLLSRKADKVPTGNVPIRRGSKSDRRLIVAVEDVPTVPTQCIAVDSPDNTYLCTESMIPTHNTAVSASLDHIQRAVHNYGYFQQAPWYLDGAAACGLGDENAAFIFVFQEKSAPYLVTVVELDRDSLDAGRNLNRRARQIYRDCAGADIWPSYSDDIELISLPPWAINRYSEESW